MPKRFICRQSLFRVEGLTKGGGFETKSQYKKLDDREAYQSLVEEIDCLHRGLRKHGSEWPPLPNGQ